MNVVGSTDVFSFGARVLAGGFLVWLPFALIIFGLPSAFLALQRGREPITWAVVAIFVGPIAVLTVGLSTRAPGGRFRSCPACHEAIDRSAERCPWCTTEVRNSSTEVNPYLRPKP